MLMELYSATVCVYIMQGTNLHKSRHHYATLDRKRQRERKIERTTPYNRRIKPKLYLNSGLPFFLGLLLLFDIQLFLLLPLIHRPPALGWPYIRKSRIAVGFKKFSFCPSSSVDSVRAMFDFLFRYRMQSFV